MTVLVDASALVAMATREAEADKLSEVIDQHDERLCCAVGLWEATLAIARKRQGSIAAAREELSSLLIGLSLRVVGIAEREADVATDAFERYGKGTAHPAQLNMGDCFAYACASTNNARLVYKGKDFARTDLA